MNYEKRGLRTKNLISLALIQTALLSGCTVFGDKSPTCSIPENYTPSTNPQLDPKNINASLVNTTINYSAPKDTVLFTQDPNSTDQSPKMTDMFNIASSSLQTLGEKQYYCVQLADPKTQTTGPIKAIDYAELEKIHNSRPHSYQTPNCIFSQSKPLPVDKTDPLLQVTSETISAVIESDGELVLETSGGNAIAIEMGPEIIAGYPHEREKMGIGTPIHLGGQKNYEENNRPLCIEIRNNSGTKRGIPALFNNVENLAIYLQAPPPNINE